MANDRALVEMCLVAKKMFSSAKAGFFTKLSKSRKTALRLDVFINNRNAFSLQVNNLGISRKL